MRATAGRRGAKGLSQRRPFGRRHSAVSDLREALARRYDARAQADLVLISESIAPSGAFPLFTCSPFRTAPARSCDDGPDRLPAVYGRTRPR